MKRETPKDRLTPRPAWKAAWYNFLHVVCRLLAVSIFRVRCRGRENLPLSGPLLVLSNHQSHLDPVLVGLVLDRRLNFVARETLFGFAPFRWLINSLDAIPIDREGLGIGGLKETLRRLKAGEAVLIFPEGTRSTDGTMGPLKSGFTAVARRGSATLLPVAINGASRAWPRSRWFPMPTTIGVTVGEALSPAEVAALSDEELLREVSDRIGRCLYSDAPS